MYKERAHRFFRLADQYFVTAQILLETLINNDNSNAGIGKTQEEAYEQMKKNTSCSDLYLFIPAVFNCLQSTELFIKGLLLLNDKEIEGNHESQSSLSIIRDVYGEKSTFYKEFNKMYNSQEDIIKQFKKENNITNTKDLYESLRYPEKKDESRTPYDFSALMYNGNRGIKLFRKMLENLISIRTFILAEYNRLYEEKIAE